MNLKNFARGLELTRPYYTDPDGYHLSAEHDQIWLHSTDKPMAEADVQAMIDAGWSQERSNYNEDMAVKHYRADESWYCFV